MYISFAPRAQIYHPYMEPSAGTHRVQFIFYNSMDDLACQDSEMGVDLSTVKGDEESISQRLAVTQAAGGVYVRQFELTAPPDAQSRGAARTAKARVVVRYFPSDPSAIETLMAKLPAEVQTENPGRFDPDGNERPHKLAVRWQGRLLPHSKTTDLLPFMRCPRAAMRTAPSGPTAGPPVPPLKCFERIQCTLELTGDFRPK